MNQDTTISPYMSAIRGNTSRAQRMTLVTATILTFVLPSLVAMAQIPLGNAFTYQGLLEQGGRPANGTFDLHFRLYDGPDPFSDNLLQEELKSSVLITDGLFTVTLNFGGGEFAGDARWLEIGAREVGEPDFSYVSPLQELTMAPYARFSQRAGDAETLDGLDSSEFVSNETDPTVLENVKDGVDWSEISNIPTGTGEPETDPTVIDSVKDGVDWSEISNIPAGTGEPETDPTVIDSVKDGVDWSEISNIPVGTGEPESDPTVAANVKDGVDWSELSGVPPGFIDGVDDTVPPGSIVMWSGPLADIPAGWALCNGTNGTPDLTNRFVLGVSTSEEPGAIGGSSSHGHSISGGAHTHDSSEMSGATSDFTVGTAGNPREAAQAGHRHTISSSGAHGHSVGSANHLPPYFKLAFIMKLPEA